MLKYKQITIEEREKIYQFLKTDISLTQIANGTFKDQAQRL